MISGYGASMSLPGSGSYTVLVWANYFDCVDSQTHLRLDGSNVQTYTGGNADSAGCDQNTILDLRSVSAGGHTWSLSRGQQHQFMWVAYR
jgi:poly(3-hydroxybutyrate) depolymerase